MVILEFTFSACVLLGGALGDSQNATPKPLGDLTVSCNQVSQSAVYQCEFTLHPASPTAAALSKGLLPVGSLPMIRIDDGTKFGTVLAKVDEVTFAHYNQQGSTFSRRTFVSSASFSLFCSGPAPTQRN
ncbi:MAG: hypothetical protein IT288_09315 [Bdellovibrionales bacterium]|nr:hypothetical protein [Bdellovibrionales bacterium]